ETPARGLRRRASKRASSTQQSDASKQLYAKLPLVSGDSPSTERQSSISFHRHQRPWRRSTSLLSAAWCIRHSSRRLWLLDTPMA
ncbi:unnamed protein product, partial [Ascophyllum nodosum]